MRIRYKAAPDVQELVEKIVRLLKWDHLLGKVFCVRAEGSSAKWTIARVHSLSKVFQSVLKVGPTYIIEVIPQAYDSLEESEKIETLIHELLHIPKACGGGLRGHRFVTKRRVKALCKMISDSLRTK